MEPGLKKRSMHSENLNIRNLEWGLKVFDNYVREVGKPGHDLNRTIELIRGLR